MSLHCIFLGITIHNKAVSLKYSVRDKGLHLIFFGGHNSTKPEELLPSFTLPDSTETTENQLTEKESNILLFNPYTSPLTIKTAMLSSKPEQQVVGFQRRSEHKYTTVKAVRPARIRSCWKLFSIKQLIDIAKHLRDSRTKRKKSSEQMFSRTWVDRSLPME